MGYYMSQQDGDFFIDKSDIRRALAHVVSWGKGTEDDDLIQVRTIDEAFSRFGFNVTYDKDGNVVDIFFEYGKLTSQDEFLFEIAPFVKSGSYLQMIGEDNEMWRWVFYKGKFEEILPEVIWRTPH